MPNGWVDNPLVFVSIAEDGPVTIVCNRSEMGQGIRTGMPMIVADELEADWKRVRVTQAPGDQKRFGNQDTDGSRSTRHFFEPMRRCGAAARTMLEAAAAERWKVPVSEVEAKNHEVVHRPTGRRFGYGSLAKAAASQPVPARETLRLKDPKRFRYIGKGQLKLVDGRDIAAGKAQYGIDTRLDGMLYARVARPRGRVLRPPPGSSHDGTARRDRTHRGRQVRGVGVLPVAAGSARCGRKAIGYVGGRRHRARHAARRWLRTQVNAGLRRRGSRALQGDGRKAGQGDLDTRGRPAPLLLPHGVGRAPGGCRRWAGQAGGLAASHRGADHHLHVQCRGEE